MSLASDRYSRLYHRLVDDEKFKDVYANDARFACWVRLLLIADAAYPSPAPIPMGLKRSALDHLVNVGLVDLLPGNRYAIHGLQAERQRRSRQPAAAARQRWANSRDASAVRPHSDRTPTGMRAEQSRDEHSTDEPREVHTRSRSGERYPESAAAIKDATTLRMSETDSWSRKELRRLCAVRGDAAVAAAISKAPGQIAQDPPSARQVVAVVLRTLEPFPSTGNGRRPDIAKGYTPDMEEVGHAVGR
jgi:hypothetical protein